MSDTCQLQSLGCYAVESNQPLALKSTSGSWCHLTIHHASRTFLPPLLEPHRASTQSRHQPTGRVGHFFSRISQKTEVHAPAVVLWHLPHPSLS